MELGRAAARVTVLQRPPEDEGSPEPVAIEGGAGVEEPVLGREGGEVNSVQTDLGNKDTDQSSIIRMQFWFFFSHCMCQCCSHCMCQCIRLI